MRRLGWFDGESDRTGLDPRTTLVYAIVVGAVCLSMAGGDSPTMSVVRWILEISVSVILAIDRRWRLLACYAIMMLVSLATLDLLVPLIPDGVGTGSAARWLVRTTAIMTLRMAPSAILAAWILSTMRVNALTAALRAMHVPDSITIALAVTLRFLPGARRRNLAIRDALRMRGIRLGSCDVGHLVEYRTVPLISGTVAAADDLTQSALTRGLALGAATTSIARIGLRRRDAVILSGCLAVVALWVITASGVAI